MKRDRFTLILKFLHLNDSTLYRKKGEPGHDPLHKLRPFLVPLLSNFQDNYTLSKEISIDETMIGFKGRLSYMPKKPTKWGMKAYVLADSHTGYMYNWYLYTGKVRDANTYLETACISKSVPLCTWTHTLCVCVCVCVCVYMFVHPSVCACVRCALN